MTKRDANQSWEQVSRDDARRIEDEVMADPEAPYPEGARFQARRLGRRTHLFTVRLSAEEYVALQRVADAQHLPASTLARAWLLDRIKANERAS